VRAYVLDNARMWFDVYGVDGLRLDAVHALSDLTILTELSALAAERGKVLIAESDLNDPAMIRPVAEGGYGMTAQWSDDYHHAAHSALTGETGGYYGDFATLDALVKAATRGFVHDGSFSTFRGRPHGAPIPPEVAPWRLVTFVQDHDQIGNRAEGDRLTDALSPARLEIAAVLNVLSPFTPMIFMGEEWAASTPWQFFTAHPEPELATATAEGRIAEFAEMGWDESAVPDPQDPETFRRSHLDWGERSREPHRRILELYRELILLRRAHPVTRFDQISAEVEGRWFRMVRGDLEVVVDFEADTWDVHTLNIT
jgi:maltooligosyltrehalose trehalohydrolase